MQPSTWALETVGRTTRRSYRAPAAAVSEPEHREEGMLIVGIILAATGFIALAVGLIRGKGNLNLSRRTTLITGAVLLVVGVVLLVVALT